MRIAITGTIGSGKTTVSDYLRTKGFYVFDCDEVNRKLLEEGNEGYLRVKEVFPECFIGNSLDKKRLSSIVFNDKKKKTQLENLLHPLILMEMYKEETKYDPFFAEVPLLFECNWDSLFDLSVLVVTSKDISLDRLVKRGISKEDALKRIDNQMPLDEKIHRADIIIYNNKDINDLYHEIDKLVEKLNVRE